VELLRQQDRMSRTKSREGLKIGGLINLGVGIALIIFLRALVGSAISLCGLFPGLIGVGMLVYVYFLAAPIE
jgi:predicted lysophospholipase L1 biosynthesis ABC-type transport system permease subunit